MEQTPEQRPRRRRKLRTAPLPDQSKGRRSRSSHSKSPARASSAPRPRRKGSKEKELRRSSTAGESVDGILKRHGLDAAEILGAADSISVSPPHQKPPEPEPEPRSDGGSEDDLVASLLQMFAAPEGEHRRVITPPPPPRKSLSPWPADMQPPASDGTAANPRGSGLGSASRGDARAIGEVSPTRPAPLESRSTMGALHVGHAPRVSSSHLSTHSA